MVSFSTDFLRGTEMDNAFWRETVVRVVSRGGDLLIANSIMWLSNNNLFLIATVAGAVWNGFTDFFGHRQITYKASRGRPSFVQEVLPYGILRGCIAVFGFAILYLLFFEIALPYYLCSIFTMLLLWYVSYQLTKVFFTKSVFGPPTGSKGGGV